MDKLLFYLRQYLIPHHTNNHRAKLLHASTMISLLTFLFIAQLSFRTLHKVRPDILGFATNITIEKLLAETNNERLKNGVKPVKINPQLSMAAEKKARDMFTQNYWAHIAPDGTSPWDFITGEGYRYTYAGENLARDFDESSGVVEAWMNSPSHKDNLIRGEYEEIGFAVVNGSLNGSDTTLVVQMFGTRSPGTVARANARPAVPVAKAQEIVPTPTTILLPTNAPPFVNSQIAETIPTEVEPSVVLGKTFQRTLALSFAGVFIAVLMIDGFYIVRKKTFRIAGHNLAHFIFLLAIVGIIVVGTSGAIL